MRKSTITMSIILSLILLSLLILFLQAGSNSTANKSVSADEIMVIPLEGSIASSSNASVLSVGAGITPDFVRHRIEDAENDPSIKAIIFKVDSPGGTVAGSQEIANLIRDAKIPVVVFAGDTIASGAYYFSSQADKIVANPGSLIGSIGVISEIPDINGLYKKLGINMQVVKSGKNKDMFSRALTQEERQKFQRLSDELYRQFINDVSMGRKIKRTEVQKLATGELFAATHAKRLRLIDDIGGYKKAIDVAARLAKIDNPVVKEYRQPPFFEQLFSMSNSKGNIIINTLKSQLLGRDLLLLENIKDSFGSPQYKYTGGR